MGRFMGVGFFSLALSLVIVSVCKNWLAPIIPEVHERISAADAIAYAITTTTAFLMNSRITFRDRHADFKAYIRYGIVSLIGFAFTVALNLAFDHIIALLYGKTDRWVVDVFKTADKFAYLSAVGCVFFWNFFMSRCWVFPEKQRS